MSIPGVPREVDDIDTVVISKRKKGSKIQTAVGIVSTVMTPPGSGRPSFYQKLQAKKAAPTARTEVTKASVAITFSSNQARGAICAVV
jgi:hypothetical protein